MGDRNFSYSEDFLQWIWENQLFECAGLRTECGKAVCILDSGERNETDGPDFKGAKMVIDGITWHGDVELHKECGGWKAHGHHTDSNYNAVFMHVITSGYSEPVKTENGSTPFTLDLGKYLSGNLRVFLNNFESPRKLPCSGNINFISEEAFYAQLEKAHTEYLEKKADDFLSFYDPEVLPSIAWKRALVLSIWDGLGIAHNRGAMRQTAEQLLNKWDAVNVEEGISIALEASGLGDDSEIQWNFKSVRPANHPKKRIKEAVRLSAQVLRVPFKSFLEVESTDLWEDWCKYAHMEHSSRAEILYGTVYLPALYVMGMLYAHQSQKDRVRTIWKDLKTPIPESLLKKLKSLSLKKKHYRTKLGSIHQLKSYCTLRKCSECFVLKKAIQS